jgi:uncharacterized protein
MNYLWMLVIHVNKNIFQQQLFLGFVNKVTTGIVTVHVPSSKYLNKFYYHGEEFHGGLINSFVVIEGENIGFIGRVISAELPEKERLDLSTEALKEKDFHPLLKVEILSIFDYFDVSFKKSISDYPNVGAKVFIARKDIIDRYIKQLEIKDSYLKTSNFAHLLNNDKVTVDFSLQTLFSRHAAIVGTTGSGKSYTTSKLVDDLLANNQKVILIDATGEYKKLAESFGNMAQIVSLGIEHHIDYRKLTIDDLFYLVKPSANSQAPKLREAIKSLKLLEYAADELAAYIEEYPSGYKILRKKEKKKEPFLSILHSNINEISTDDLNFDIRGLAIQVENECIQEGFNGQFGKNDDRSLGFCTTMITRINLLLTEGNFNRIFNFSGENITVDTYELLENFISQNNEKLFYINLSDLPFLFDIREVVANSIGKKMLYFARQGKFKKHPIVMIIDEAHQFLNKTVSNDFESFKLEAYDNIAKEGRKYGLFLCITTQRPRDIPSGTLSQIGTFIVHRLINQKDKEIILNALPTSNKDIINYLSELGQGEIIISSTDIKIPLLLKVKEPSITPDSVTPVFTEYVGETQHIELENDERLLKI